MNDLYRVFRCNTKEELYEKLKAGDKDTLELKEFIEFSKLASLRNKVKITSTEVMGDLLNKLDIPKDNQVYMIFTNTSGEAIHISIFDLNSNVKDFRKAVYPGFNSKAAAVALVFSDKTDRNKINNLTDNIRVLGIKVFDSLQYSRLNKSYFSTVGEKYLDERKNEELLPKVKDNNISNKKVNDFLRYYAEKEIIGKDIFYDEAEITNTLRVGLKNLAQEYAYLVTYDNKQKINEVVNISLGAIDSAYISYSALAKELIRINPEGFLIFHNHPSGNINPSEGDKLVTKKIETISEILGYDFHEHYVVAENGVFKINELEEVNLGLDTRTKELTFSFSNDKDLEF